MKRLCLAILFCLFVSSAHALTFSNFASSTLASPLGSGATAIVLSSGTGTLFPQTGSFKAIIFSAACTQPSTCALREIVTLSFSSGDTFNVAGRAQEGTTTPTTWPAGTRIVHSVTAASFNLFASAVSGTTGTTPCMYGRNGASDGCWSAWDQDFTNNMITLPSGSQLPLTCKIGNEWNLTSAGTGLNHYICTQQDTWTRQSEGLLNDTGQLSINKANGYPDFILLLSSHSSDSTGAGIIGPNSSSGMAHSWYLQLPETEPSSGQVLQIGTPTQVSYPTGTYYVVPMTFVSPAWAYPSAGISISTGTSWGTSLTPPSGAVVGTTDTQTLSNKSIIGLTVISAATATLTQAQVASTVISNYGQSGAATLTLPAIACGYNFVLEVDTQYNAAWTIQRQGSDTLCLDGVCSKTSIAETNQPVGSSLACVAAVTGAGPTCARLNCKSVTGTWN